MTSLKYISQEPYKRLTIQIVAPGEFIEPLKESLLADNKEKYKNTLQFVFCEDVEEVISWIDEHGNVPDYIAIVLDPRHKACLQVAEENINKLDPIYGNGGKLCLVNGACSIKPSEMGVGLGHINILPQKYSIILINGDVLIPDKCKYLASRILLMATTVCGYFTGIPVSLDIPGYDADFK